MYVSIDFNRTRGGGLTPQRSLCRRNTGDVVKYEHLLAVSNKILPV